ncbi:MAG: hypothetical protein HYX53_03455 [Chloroflexi bacterium]|nr:hypothetical protein [Chloroflexota bacterium]
MTARTFLRIAASALILALGVMLPMGAGAAFAQAPPNPPSRFAGTVTIGGQPAPAGTAVVALIAGTACGTGTTFIESGQARYTLDSPQADSTRPGCGTDGAAVTFTVGGAAANETGVWRNYQLNIVNLTVSGAATPTPTQATTPTATITPGPPSTGTGNAPGSGSALSLVLAGGVVALAAGGAGFVALRKPGSRRG